MKNFLIKNISKIEEELFPLNEAKSIIRVVGEHDDLIIISLINAAVEFAEQYTGRYIYKRKVLCLYEAHSGKEIILPSRDVISVESIKIINSTEADLEYERDFTLSRDSIILAKNYERKTLEISYISGFEVLPESIRQGIFLHLAMLYDKEIMSSEMRESLFLLYKQYRNLRIF